MLASLSQSLGLALRQELKLQQVIQLCKLMAVPDEVLGVVLGVISLDPSKVEGVLRERKQEQGSSGDGVVNKTQAIYSHLVQPSGNVGMGGFIGSPNLGFLEDRLENVNIEVTPDVTYVGRRGEKPEVVFSDHLNRSAALSMVQIEKRLYPETSRLFYQLTNFDRWRRETLIKAYPIIGDTQREYFEDFDTTRLHKFTQSNLADQLGITVSTISRLLSSRWVEARNTAGERRVILSKDLFVDTNDLRRYEAIPLFNAIFKEEFEIKRAYSDEKLADKLGILRRRTVTKHRTAAEIPGCRERDSVYGRGERKEPYLIKSYPL